MAKDALSKKAMVAKLSMKTIPEEQTSGFSAEDRNIMLYWDDAPPSDIVAVAEKWQNFCPEWNVVLFCKESATRFLLEKYGKDIVRLFLTCAVPAMRSDFFRVFWVISEGGLYSDVKFLPIRDPQFFDSGKNLTVAKLRGRIKNGFFFCKKDCKELKSIAFEIIKAISKKEIQHIAFATGPRAWKRVLGKTETDTVKFVDWHTELFTYVQISNYQSNTKGSRSHWRQLQLQRSIYQTPHEMPEIL